MNLENQMIMNQYIKITEFMGRLLGRDYEIVLHSLEDVDHSIVAIANNYISGREIGGPLTNVALQIISDKSYMTHDFRAHYAGVSKDGKRLASSTLFIKNSSNELIGLLCVNFDPSRYEQISEMLLALRHVDPYIDANFQFDESLANLVTEIPEKSTTQPPREEVETFFNSTDAVTKDFAHQAMVELGITSDRLTADEKIKIVEKMNERGAFLMKGAVKEAAEVLDCSQATVYRYLAEIRERKDQSKLA